MRVAGIKKIFLAEMADVRADFLCDVQMVVDDQADIGAAGDGQDFFSQRTDFVGSRIFCAKLDQVAAAVAKLLRDEFGRAAVQIGRVHESVKLAVGERFHFVVERKTAAENLPAAVRTQLGFYFRPTR